ncbi:MAG: hypothetical protein RL260_1019 [Pseudomonadota bacterium]
MTETVAWLAGVPSDFRALAWRVFFTSRGRGISLAHHFPWIDQECRTVSVCAWVGGTLVGGLVIRRIPMSDGGQCGLVGLVCVEASERGKGWSHRLLEVATAQAGQQGLTALLLWTQKPEVYARHGFVLGGSELLGDVVSRSEVVPLPLQTEQPWPSETVSIGAVLRGLPAFARSARRLDVETARGVASAIVLETAAGPAVAEWHGDEHDVAELLVTSLPQHWVLNAIEGDRLVGALQACGCSMQLRPSRTRFVRWVTPDTGRVLPDVRVLDRV